MSIQNKLESEIMNELDILADMEVGTDNYKTTIDGLTKLMDRSIEMDKIILETEAEKTKREIESNLKAQEIKIDKRDRIVKNVLAGVTFVGGAALTVWGTLSSFKFEETGNITTIMGRKFFDRLLPKK